VQAGFVTQDVPVLDVRDIEKGFAGNAVLKGVSIAFHGGRIHALLGENGAGKSTLMKIISGVYTPDSGTISLDGAAIKLPSPQAALHAGISMVHQELSSIPSTSVAENIFLGREIRHGALVDRSAMRDEARRLCAQIGVDLDVNREMARLSPGEAQLVEIVKAVSRNARVLIMDEPTSSLTFRETQRLFELLRRLRSEGVAIVYISHKLEEIYEIADELSVLRDGVVTLHSTSPSEISRHDLVRAMVGRALTQFYPGSAGGGSADVVFEVRNLTRRGEFNDVSFCLHKGEILGFAGLIGAGRSETMLAAFGDRKFDSGEILVGGRPAPIHSPRDAIAHGIALIPEDRKRLGLVERLPIRNNLNLAALESVSKNGIVRRDAEARSSQELIRQLQIRASSIDLEAAYLSGGNQQKIVVGKWLRRAPLRVLILDEPTKGIDVSAKHELYVLVRDLAASGTGVILVSSELPELLGMTDRIIVMRRGRISGEFVTAGTTQEQIMGVAI
jgi:ABC-type sugar transport system ATPase subunit